jgi:hypothetical protein
MFQIFGILSGILSIFCYIPYIRDILAKKTKPERASWFIWSVLGGIAFFSQYAKGATDSLWLTGVQTIGVALIFALSLKFGMGGLAKRDIIALVAAVIGVMFWIITREAAIALLFVFLIDVAGSVLTMVKSYEDPGSETLSTWILAGTSGFFGALAVGSWNIILLSYPAYIFIINFIIAGTVILGKRNKPSHLRGT